MPKHMTAVLLLSKQITQIPHPYNHRKKGKKQVGRLINPPNDSLISMRKNSQILWMIAV
jgi:hypothetical protein